MEQPKEIPKPKEIVQKVEERIEQWKHGLITSTELAVSLGALAADLGFSAERYMSDWERYLADEYYGK